MLGTINHYVKNQGWWGIWCCGLITAHRNLISCLNLWGWQEMETSCGIVLKPGKTEVVFDVTAGLETVLRDSKFFLYHRTAATHASNDKVKCMYYLASIGIYVLYSILDRRLFLVNTNHHSWNTSCVAVCMVFYSCTLKYKSPFKERLWGHILVGSEYRLSKTWMLKTLQPFLFSTLEHGSFWKSSHLRMDFFSLHHHIYDVTIQIGRYATWEIKWTTNNAASFHQHRSIF